MPVQKERIQKDIETINEFNATPGNGITRLTFTPEYQGAVDYVVEELKLIGADISIGPAGNVRGRLDGSEDHGPAVMMGSHLDSVAHGGPFDGVVGVVTALETARAIAGDSIKHRLPVDVVIFAEEEGSRFGQGLLGSSIWTGQMRSDQLVAIKDDDGVSYLEAMALAGLTVDDQNRLEPANLRAMLEVHIEQGATLEKKGKRIGLVEAIVGINQFEVTIEGMANHAGTTAMAHRLDALQGAVRIIAAVEDIALRTAASTVVTVGKVVCDPGQSNVIPGRVKFSLDVRDADAAAIESAVAQIIQVADRVCKDRGLTFKTTPGTRAAPVALSSSLIELMDQKAAEMQIKPLRMDSGAGHDTAVMAGLTASAMIFLPSKDGRSHCPEEFTSPEDIKLGCELLLATAIELSA